MSDVTISDYWIVRRDSMLVKLDNSLVHFKPAIAEIYGRDELEYIVNEIRTEFSRLILQLPFIGEENPNILNIIDSALLLAFYRSLSKRGATIEQAAETFFKGYRKYVLRTMFILRWIEKRKISQPRRIKQLLDAASASQARRYPGDFVFEVTVDQEPPTEINTIVTECGAMKFMQAQNAMELMPYVCHIDYVLYNALDVEFRCLSSLAYGHDKCHYRLRLNRKPLPAWPLFPPEGIEAQV